jgi:hypothetical protein
MPAIHAMTAITCSALIHSYIVDASFVATALFYRSQHRNVAVTIGVVKNPL